VLDTKLALFVTVIVALSFAVLTLLFRSLAIPLAAAAMNLLSIGAALGIMVAAFQWNWAGPALGISRPGPIEPYLPVLIFAILFGLSMDYQVFLLTRIHEEWQRTGSTRAAVRHGLAATGRTITSAALIMIAVFASFIPVSLRIVEDLGLGLAGGILIDAVIIRTAIVPALMIMLGRANWWLPGWLGRLLPRLHVQVTPDTQAAGTAGRGQQAHDAPMRWT
jgi:RND superfamily putative drug exporter